MRGNSGAELIFTRGRILKTCSDAIEQNEWFEFARNLPLINGISIPQTNLINEASYEIEFIDGVPGTHLSSTLLISVLIDQILLWSKCNSIRSHLSWRDYLNRIYTNHVSQISNEVVNESFEVIENLSLTIPPTFCHGDLTLENIIISNGNNDLVIIDPNFKPDLFQSYILDLGKLLQSTHSNYHHRFNSSPGVDLKSHNELLIRKLREIGVLKESLVAEITHILRLRKYQPLNMQFEVDELLTFLVDNLKKS